MATRQERLWGTVTAIFTCSKGCIKYWLWLHTWNELLSLDYCLNVTSSFHALLCCLSLCITVTVSRSPPLGQQRCATWQTVLPKSCHLLHGGWKPIISSLCPPVHSLCPPVSRQCHHTGSSLKSGVLIQEYLHTNFILVQRSEELLGERT